MEPKNSNPSSTRFLNVDIDICSSQDLAPLVDAFRRKVVVLYAGPVQRMYRAHLELARMSKSADATIRALCALIDKLPVKERQLWNNAKVRDFNIGIQSGYETQTFELVLGGETLKSICALSARVAFTVYAPETR